MTLIAYPVSAARRGTYCEAVVPASTYVRRHCCLIVHGLRKVRGRFLCSRHQKPRRGA